MSQSLELPDPIFSALQHAAEASGLTPEAWIAAQLPSKPVGGTATRVESLADLFSGRIGRIRSGGRETLSDRCGERFADDLEVKRREGQL